MWLFCSSKSLAHGLRPHPASYLGHPQEQWRVISGKWQAQKDSGESGEEIEEPELEDEG
jgi:hypothetical protein